MNIETAANPAGGDDTRVETPAPDATNPEAQAPAEGDAPLSEELAPEAPLALEEDEFEEIERGEKKYRIPKELKSEFLMHQDYTRKTMELADQRRALEAAKAEVERAQTLTTEERRAYASLDLLSGQIAQYEKVDWDALESTDPVEAQRHWRTFQTLKEQRQTTFNALQQHEAQKAAQAQQEAAKRREETEARVAKEIPNWPTRKLELEKFAADHGLSSEDLALARAEDFKLLNYAYEGFRFVERQRAAARAAAQGAIKPAPEVGGTAAAGADPSTMSMEQYKAWRASQGG